MFNEPPLRDIPKGVIIPAGWIKWLTSLYNYVSCIGDHGTTAQRPTKNLFIGRPYFDDDLGYPIWIKTVDPIDWVDATGISV